jgi:hypothetical protein
MDLSVHQQICCPQPPTYRSALKEHSMNNIRNLTFASSLVFLAANAFAAVTVNNPSNGSAVSTPFNLSASASSCSLQNISAMGYSLDNSASTIVVKGSSMNVSVGAATGAHTLHVKSWGSQGASCVTDVAVTIAGAPAPALVASVAVSVSSPSNGTNVTSPFTLMASAASCAGNQTSAMGYSFDNSTSTTIVNGASINSPISSPNGAHTLHVKAWGNGGGSCDTDVAVTVTVPANAAVVPAGAVSVSAIQAMNGWAAVNDTAGSGRSTGAHSLVGTPAYSGTARQFVTNYTNGGNERYYVSFGDDTESTNFMYDGWVYLNGSSSSIGNIEMDMNQTMPNGQTAIFGFQCDGYNNTWDYTENKGTPQNPVDAWDKSTASCNPRSWSINTWHHVQISYSRDDAGNITYKSVWLDDVQQNINATVNSAFALGWAPSLLTNFQVDGLGASGSNTAYLDDLTIYRW